MIQINTDNDLIVFELDYSLNSCIIILNYYLAYYR